MNIRPAQPLRWAKWGHKAGVKEGMLTYVKKERHEATATASWPINLTGQSNGIAPAQSWMKATGINELKTMDSIKLLNQGNSFWGKLIPLWLSPVAPKMQYSPGKGFGRHCSQQRICHHLSPVTQCIPVGGVFLALAVFHQHIVLASAPKSIAFCFKGNHLISPANT